jgi:hypothetical protein
LISYSTDSALPLNNLKRRNTDMIGTIHFSSLSPGPTSDE